jgi:hypothetical protein
LFIGLETTRQRTSLPIGHGIGNQLREFPNHTIERFLSARAQGANHSIRLLLFHVEHNNMFHVKQNMTVPRETSCISS